jgi:hypothetical protein
MSKSVIVSGTWVIEESVGEVDVDRRVIAEETVITHKGNFAETLTSAMAVDYEIPLGVLTAEKKVFINVEADKTVLVRFNNITGTQFTMRGTSQISMDVTHIYVSEPNAGAVPAVTPVTTVQVDIIFAG